MKKEPHPATALPLNLHSRKSTFQFDDWTFTLPEMDEKFFDQGALDVESFSKAFAEQNGHQVFAKSVILAAVAHFAVNHFPNTAAELLIKFSDQVSQDRFTVPIVH
jgi:hypothetical protein